MCGDTEVVWYLLILNEIFLIIWNSDTFLTLSSSLDRKSRENYGFRNDNILYMEMEK